MFHNKKKRSIHQEGIVTKLQVHELKKLTTEKKIDKSTIITDFKEVYLAVFDR